MAKLRYKSIIPNTKPEWLLQLQVDISNQHYYVPFSDLETLKRFIDDRIHGLIMNGTINRSIVSTEVRTDSGKTVLLIIRNERVIQTYYFES